MRKQGRDAAAGVVVVGAGAAGTAAVGELRRLGFEGAVTVVGAEPHAPYNRTAVNKGLLQGRATLESVTVPVADHARTGWALGLRATGLDVAARRVRLEDGREIAYDALLVATGADPRPLHVPVPSQARDLVRTLRTASEARDLRERLAAIVAARSGAGARVAVVGAGVLGSELADTLAEDGHDVTLLARGDVPMRAVLGETVGTWLRRRQEQQLTARYGVEVASVDPTGPPDAPTGVRLHLSDGAAVEADLVLVALGVAPAVGWLTGVLDPSGMDVAAGIAVDDRLRVRSADRVYAAGDLARLVDGPGPHRFEHRGHALAQGTHVARVIAHDLGLAEDPGAFSAPASFATRLHGRAVTVLGHHGPTDREVVLSGAVEDSVVTIGLVDPGGRLAGVVSLGSPKVANRLRPLVAAGSSLGEAVRLLVEADLAPGSPAGRPAARPAGEGVPA